MTIFRDWQLDYVRPHGYIHDGAIAKQYGRGYESSLFGTQQTFCKTRTDTMRCYEYC